MFQMVRMNNRKLSSCQSFYGTAEISSGALLMNGSYPMAFWTILIGQCFQPCKLDCKKIENFSISIAKLAICYKILNSQRCTSTIICVVKVWFFISTQKHNYTFIRSTSTKSKVIILKKEVSSKNWTNNQHIAHSFFFFFFRNFMSFFMNAK